MIEDRDGEFVGDVVWVSVWSEVVLFVGNLFVMGDFYFCSGSCVYWGYLVEYVVYFGSDGVGFGGG